MASELASDSAAAADARLVRLAAAQLLKIAAIAYDNFGFEFMLHPFRYIENRSVSRHFYKIVPRIASGAGSVRSKCCSNASGDMQKLDSPMRKWHQSLRSTNNLRDVCISPQRPVGHFKMQLAGVRVRIRERDSLVEFDAEAGRGRRNHIP